MRSAVSLSPLSIVLTDPRLEDNPITYVNDAFERLTLFSKAFAMGRNCRFLQGPETDPADVERIRDGMRSEAEFQVTLTNYRADGTPFRNQLLIAPIHSEDGELTAFFGVQREVAPDARDAFQGDQTLALLSELQHRVKNHLSMIVSMIRVQASREVTPESLKAISRRIEALALLYDELVTANANGGKTHDVAAGAYLSRVASVVAGLQSRGAIRLNVACEEISLPVTQAARLGLLLSEFLTNALEHAFVGRSSGAVEVRFHRLSGGAVRLSVQDDGIGMPSASDWPFGAPSIETQTDRAERDEGALDTTGHRRKAGVGGSIVAALIRSLGATLTVTSPDRGTYVAVDVTPES